MVGKRRILWTPGLERLVDAQEGVDFALPDQATAKEHMDVVFLTEEREAELAKAVALFYAIAR